MSLDFSQLLSKPAADIKRPPNFPAGTYFGTVKTREFGESKNKKTPQCALTLGGFEPGNDIDPAQMAGIDVTKRTMQKTFFLTPESEYRIVELCKSCGIATDGRTLGEIIEDLPGQRVIVEMLLKPNQNNAEEFHNEIGNIKGAQ